MQGDADRVEKIKAMAPGLLARLRAERAGKLMLAPTQRKAAMVLLRRVMTAAEIRAAMNEPAKPAKPRTVRGLAGKKQRRA